MKNRGTALLVRVLSLTLAVTVAASAFSCHGTTPQAAPPTPQALAIPHEEDCGNWTMSGDFYLQIEGRVAEVTSPRSFLLDAGEHGELTVVLPNVGEPFHETARKRLEEWLAGQPVAVLAGGTDFQSVVEREGRPISGEVHISTPPDISERLLREGLAAYVTAPPYTLSGYSECLNRIAEREARAERVGIWADSGE